MKQLRHLRAARQACIAALAICCTPSFAFTAPSSDEAIYRVVVDRMVKRDPPPRFAIWDSSIAPSTIRTPRVPRHLPETQFTRALRGLPPSLQASLLVDGDHRGEGSQIRFHVPATTRAFAGFVKQDVLRQETGRGRRQDWLLGIGLSRVVYDAAMRNALVYAESCMAVPDGVCGGEGYWFVRAGQHWRLKRHAYLWQGTDRPFWEFADEVTRGPQ